MGINIVKGFVEAHDLEGLERAREGMLVEILAIINITKEQLIEANNPFRVFLEACLERFAEKVTLEGVENVPEEDKAIIASNHPFGLTDVASLTDCLLRKQPDRPWQLVGNGSLMGLLTQGVGHMKPFTDWFIPVTREGGKTFSKAVNRDEIIDKATDFLERDGNQLLFIAPEGADVAYQNRLGRPYKGFAEIAKRSQAPIVPVLFTGEADLNNKKFRIHGEILEPFEASKDPVITCNEWVKRLNKRLAEQSADF